MNFINLNKKCLTQYLKKINYFIFVNACIPLGAKADCSECGEEGVLIHHVIEHAKGKRAVYQTKVKLIASKDSIQCLAGLDSNTLSGFWIFYKKIFRFKIRKMVR